MLAAYCRAGRPDMGLKPWGSYEGWTSLVRGAIVWAGMPDPGDARMTMTEGVDRDSEVLKGLLLGWGELDPLGTGLTVAEAMALLADPMNQSRYPTMRGVMAELFDVSPGGKQPLSRKLGYKLRNYTGRNVVGKCFLGEPSHGGVTRWRVHQLGPGVDRGHPAGSFSGQTGQRTGESGGDGDDVSPPLAREKKSSSSVNGSGEGEGNITTITTTEIGQATEYEEVLL
jgi:hypothetical protein